MSETSKLYTIHQEFQDVGEHARLITDRYLFVVLAPDKDRALAMAKAAQITPYRELGTWTLEEVSECVVRCRP